ncbi:S8 family serine peptidase [Kutzneria sp. NPDC051319]|uniref:S8 family serine peptidase n=1 Tax=Kutzneria sp. NPDC051319 TaxID=3155047 RepID=UPI003448F8B8
MRYSRRSLGVCALTAAVVAATAAMPAGAFAAPAASGVYDHSVEKGQPGTHGPLPAGFSHTEIDVKFRSAATVRLRSGKAVAADAGETTALQAVLARYPGSRMRRTMAESEQAVDARRTTLQSRTGRQLPDLNSWYTIDVPKGIESLLGDLNALPSVEFAGARPTMKSVDNPTPAAARPNAATVVDPLRNTQVYRQSSATASGIDADYAHGLPGGRGEGITVTDVEGGGQDQAETTFGSVASGTAHSLMVWREGSGHDTVRAWGLNSSGQLGTGTTTNAGTFTLVKGLTDVKAVAAGGNFSMALKTDGTVWTWGANGNGQLGNGTTTNSTAPVQVSGLSTVTSIAVGSNFAVAVLSDGTARAWGANNTGQLGDGTTTQRLTPVTVHSATSLSAAPGAIAAGTSHAIALKASGAVVAWGSNSVGQLGKNPSTTTSSTSAVTVSGVSGATQVAAAATASYALLSSGAVSDWGGNSAGQLGSGNTTNRFTPATVSGLTSVTVVAAGGSSAVVARTDQTVKAWGLNSNGQLGDGTTTQRLTPVAVSASGVQVAMGATQTIAADPSGFVWNWGANASGQLGINTTTASSSPVEALNITNLWNTCHEDLSNRPAPAGPPVRLQVTTGSPCQPPGAHGTGAVGFVGAQDDNGIGIDGLLPAAKLQLVSGWDWGGSVDLAITHSQPGDVIWFEVELGAYLGGSGNFPWEHWGPIYDEVVTAVAAGITVVEPAGNGSNDLDNPNDPDAVDTMSRPDSGAIIVGAGQPSSNMPWTVECKPTDPHPAPRTARDFSTYGSRVNVQGWANCITSLGSPGPVEHDMTPTETDPNKMYWSNFNGTSGASPMVVGAIGSIQGVVKQSGPPLTPAQVRTLVENTGAPQPGADPHHIGPLPDIRAALASL